LDSQYIFVGSHFGDSQLLRLHPTSFNKAELPTLPIPAEIVTVNPADLSSNSALSKGKGKARAISPDAGLVGSKARGRIINSKGNLLEVVERYANVAPAVSAALIKSNGGQSEIITCSGGMNTGALKVVRKGAAFESQAYIDGVDGVLGMWPLSETFRTG
jgi:DNA damage-binding protein 1